MNSIQLRDSIIAQCNKWWGNYNIEFIIDKYNSNFKLTMFTTRDRKVYCNINELGSARYSIEDWLTAFAHELGHLLLDNYLFCDCVKLQNETDIDKFQKALIEIKCDIFAKELMLKSGYLPSSRFLYYSKDLNKSDFNSGCFSCLERLTYYNKGYLNEEDILLLLQKYLPFHYQALLSNNPSALIMFNNLVKNFVRR